MIEDVLLRSVILLLPVTIWCLLFVQNINHSRANGAAVLVFVWQFQFTYILYIVFYKIGIVDFVNYETEFYGVPLDLILGQSILLGPVSFMFFHRRGVVLQVILASAFMAALYNIEGLVQISRYLTYQICIVIVASIIPSFLLAKWTLNQKHLYLRSFLQAICWAILLMWLFPSYIFYNSHFGWDAFLGRELTANILYLLPLILPGAILTSALVQFAIEGNGTGYPYDPPHKLVYKGVYGYVSNPMQIGVCLTMAWWGVVLDCYVISLSALVAILMFKAFKHVCNGSSDVGAKDPMWTIYQKEVPKWIPRTKPWKMPKK